MSNSIIRRSLAAASVTLFISGLLAGGASAAEVVTGTAEALPRLECEGRVERPTQDGDIVRARAVTRCRDEVEVIGVRTWLQKYDDGEWKNVEEDLGRREDARWVRADAEAQCERGRYRTVSEHFARDGKDDYRDRKESESVRIRCR
ncbi:hypothetical protein [Amycolatopsis decaplanina]|uniref:Secreted protein n=1 Tax=Amycolatopsis decaplanina DSM 44594 TaxID=1284240 RepID=M2Z7T4_9PSEU|nr:hypothetical protein [Amycolatopsis decaplanina]EME63332.1 hypothetical protein H074_05522 [Amycolatopsis decaplanina DSM 44594]